MLQPVFRAYGRNFKAIERSLGNFQLLTQVPIEMISTIVVAFIGFPTLVHEESLYNATLEKTKNEKRKKKNSLLTVPNSIVLQTKQK